MKTFDYISAWHHAAKPAYESLPQNVRDLVARTALVAADLHQLSDCSMPWPSIDNDPQASDVSGVQGFREAFRQIPAEWLALAAQIVHGIGHWYPSASAEGYEVPGRNHGSTWKFAHYADQDLRERLGLPARGANGHENGWGYAVHEGAIRITFSSKDEWTWVEVAPATQAGMDRARAILASWKDQIAAVTGLIEKANTRYQCVEAFRAFVSPESWPASWLPFVDHRFMLEEQTIKTREGAKPRNLAKDKAAIIKKTEQEIANAERERDGMIWFLDHGIPVENCIYYDHTNTFTFGWRDPVIDDVVSKILDVISEFPYAYAIKCADGRKLEGGQG